MDLSGALRVTALVKALEEAGNPVWAGQLGAQFDQLIAELNNGNLLRWWQAYTALPEITADTVDLAQVGAGGTLSAELQSQLTAALQGLHPWRKGPFDLFGVHIDTEWRSDWKWQRVVPHISPLQNRRVLDVGCGNGYFSWRMAAQGARLVVGIDPNWLFMVQFLALQKYLGTDWPVYLLPFPMEALPRRQQAFDTVFSMGVFYHRRSPFDHLAELADCLRAGGELVLETLVIEGRRETALVPGERYARMRNVWFIPSSATLCDWLARAGFEDCRVVDESVTTIDEQRATEWMTFESLDKCLNPDNPALTVEGYPAPRRAVVIAQKPG